MNGIQIGEKTVKVLLADEITDCQDWFDLFGIIVPDVGSDLGQARVITCLPKLPGDDGSMSVTCINMSGEELATIVAEPGKDVAWLRAALASQIALPIWKLQLVGVDGELLGDNVSISAVPVP